MEENGGINLNALHRGQCLYEDKPLKSMPIKRITLTKDKEILFNPDQDRYIFFSPNYMHHTYYMIKKMMDTMNAFLAKLNKERLCISGRDFGDINKIKKACNCLGMLKKEIRIESLSILYLAQVKKLIDDCSIDTQLKLAGQHIPEKTDRRVHGGGLGLTDDWLELLKYTSLFVKTKTFDLDNFFELLLEKKQKKLNMMQLCEMFESQHLTLHKLKHISEKNAINNIYQSIDNIFEKNEYNPRNKALNEAYFSSQRRLIKKDRNQALIEMSCR